VDLTKAFSDTAEPAVGIVYVADGVLEPGKGVFR
jgi:hypothetical protein